MNIRTWLTLLIFALSALLIALFTAQNLARATQLSLNVGFAAWQLSQPVPVVGLVFGSFGLGLVIGAILMLRRSFRLSRRIRELEQQAALGSAPDWR